MKKIILDLETKSEYDLLTSNAWRYSEHPSTDIVVLAYKEYEKDKVFTWFPGDPVPAVFTENNLFIAHSVQFEYSLFFNVLIPRYGFPERLKEVYSWSDTVPMCRCHGLPGGLDKATRALGAKERKMSEGKQLIKKFSKPKGYKSGRPVWHETTETEFNLFVEYCKQDVRATEFLFKHFENAYNWHIEKSVFYLDLMQNLKGLPVDVKSNNMIIKAVDLATQNAEELAKNYGINPRSPKQIIEYVKENFNIQLKDTRQDTLFKILANSKVPEELKKLIKLRLFMSRSSVKKFEALQNRTGPDNKLRQFLIYHGAHTGRWSGAGFQPQNMPRSKTPVKEIEKILKAFKNNEVSFWSTMDQAKKVLPGMIKAEPKKAFIMGDFAAIEARVLAYMAGQADLLDIFKNGGDPYINMASKLYGVRESQIRKDSPERQLGKTIILACGYGQGHRKFVETCEKMAGVKLTEAQAKKAVETYRNGYKKIPEFWTAAMENFKNALYNPGKNFITHGCVFHAEKGKFCYIQLPSGRRLYYYNLQYNKDRKEYSYLNFRSNTRTKLYGGILVENIVQAVARDIMVECMLTLEDRGLNTLFHVHDEIICYEEKAVIKQKKKIFDEVMNEAPIWLPGFPLMTESEICSRYHK
jgi:DNA polymerase